MKSSTALGVKHFTIYVHAKRDWQLKFSYQIFVRGIDNAKHRTSGRNVNAGRALPFAESLRVYAAWNSSDRIIVKKKRGDG